MAPNGLTSRLSQRAMASILCVLLSLALPATAGKVTLPRPADPFLDPKHDPYNPLKYIASDALTGVAIGLILLVALTQSVLTIKWGAYWMLSLVIGGYTFATGFACRFPLAKQPESKPIYGAEYIFIILSPCAFIAANYVLLGRIARHLDCAKYLLIPARAVAIIFISSDVITFLIQAAGGIIAISAASDDLATTQTGGHIFLAGLALQLASYANFTLIYLLFLYRVRKHNRQIWEKDMGKKWFNDWRALAGALTFSCAGILIRSVYRTIELSQGFNGQLTTVEGYFYGLDTLPLFLATLVYCFFWPGRFIRPVDRVMNASTEFPPVDGGMGTELPKESSTESGSVDEKA